MTQPLLSILIPTVFERQDECERLINRVKEQNISEQIQIYSLIDGKQLTIGEKREQLYLAAKGIYSWQIDDDDDISNNAIQLVLEAIKRNPGVPCITFREKCIMNGIYQSSNHSIKYDKWQDNFDGYNYVRCPFYKDVIRTDIAKSVPFEHIRYNEDERWSMAIKPFLTDEIHIDEEIYHYIYNETPHAERYGIK